MLNLSNDFWSTVLILPNHFLSGAILDGKCFYFYISYKLGFSLYIFNSFILDLLLRCV